MPLYHLEKNLDIQYAVYKNLRTKKLVAKYKLPAPYAYEECPLYTCKTAKCILEKRQAMFDQDSVWYDVVDDHDCIISITDLEILTASKSTPSSASASSPTPNSEF